jgi:hypothetical protein
MRLNLQRLLNPFRFVLISSAGWLNQQLLFAMEYLREENRVLREQLGGRKIPLSNDQRRRLAAKARRFGRVPLEGPFPCLRSQKATPYTSQIFIACSSD